ncbi:hypothetical protein [Vibrio vulnificus]|nr:hypothetical protein [Vibrio vulnificus]
MDEKVQIAFGVWAGVSLLGYVHNKAFKRDSCRVAFLVCSEFWW